MQGKYHLCTQFILKTKHKSSNLLPSTSIEYISPFSRTRYSILIAINSHIDCSNNSKCSVRSIFSFIFCTCNARKISSLHTIYSKTKHKSSNLLPSTSVEYISPFSRTRYSILIAINIHIDCSNHSKCSVRCIFKATARNLESVTFIIFCYSPL